MSKSRIFADLIADHERQRELITRIAETSGDSPERRELFETLRRELQAHAAAEEETLYATMLADPELRDDARHSVSEHKEVDDILGELVETEMSSPGWLTRFKTMRERYLHHIDEEEEEMFPTAEKRLSAAEEERLGRAFERRKPRELERAESELPGDARE
ncbi:hemerythrin domain-containing protein [Sphingomonas canadensis]|uniref:Hemerythrin domain-containing protein n=1 Tax=Sphingomonas canadensis TaxID=1219257 RepID=A0ABW3H1V0_9SPHN|nr:hemerythrin domain-containing protein [Sphingomonas canadensis]MCW3834659.1 hemerythrin domain-containing protein [Sphingomonas canadensis]